jgi:thiol-disulfide isomerase/thioredoxin
MRKHVLALFILIQVLAPAQAKAWDNLDIRGWLGEPGVKLLAVEFYATWCKPCNEAIPKWKELQDKYRARGLRLVVVAVQSDGSCASPSWTPDKVVCDYEGDIAERWKASALPQAFLWSWQGNSLVSHGTVEQVDKAIGDYFAGVPRILVSDPVNLRGEKLDPDQGRLLKQLVRGELKRASKFDLVADQKEKEEIRRLRKEAITAGYNEDTMCKLGQEVSPNSQLKITLVETKRSKRLRLELFSLEKGCLTASSHAPIMDDDLEAASVEAVAKLSRGLMREVQTPMQGSKPTVVEKAPPRKVVLPKVVASPPPVAKGYEELAREAAAAQKGRDEVLGAWKIVHGVASARSAPKKRRIAALRKFLADYPDDNPYSSAAENMLLPLELGRAARFSWLDLSIAAPLDLPMGGMLELMRWRFRYFQFAFLNFMLYLNPQDGDRQVYSGGLLGLGLKWNFGSGGAHEFGFLSYPLSFGYESHNWESTEWVNESTGNVTDFRHETFAFLFTRVYYRYTFSAAHVETGLYFSPFWTGDEVEDGMNKEDDTPYAGSVPIYYYLGGGF